MGLSPVHVVAMTLTESFQRLTEQHLLIEGAMNDSARADAETAISRLYELVGRRAPAIVWCKSIYQLATFPSLLMGMMHSQIWPVIESSFAERPQTAQWHHEFEQAWAELWSTCGFKLMRGMNDTSRIGRDYFEQEALLIQQVKGEIARLLAKNELRAFHDELPKETIYRRYWGLQWQRSFLLERVSVLERILESRLQDQFQAKNDEFVQFEPNWERIARTCISGLASIRSLSSSMGAEPHSQVSQAVWLPLMIPQAILSQIWRAKFPSQLFMDFDEELNLLTKLSCSCFGFLALDQIVFICQRPLTYMQDEGQRPHAESCAAIKFADGMEAYFWHGVLVESRLILHPEEITVDEIESTRNLELRRVLIERYGPSRYLQQSGAMEIHSDECGTLYRCELDGDEALVMVKVVNSTAEPDGSFREYFLRVPPDTMTAKQAVAWTFGLEEEEYKPLAET